MPEVGRKVPVLMVMDGALRSEMKMKREYRRWLEVWSTRLSKWIFNWSPDHGVARGENGVFGKVHFGFCNSVGSCKESLFRLRFEVPNELIK